AAGSTGCRAAPAAAESRRSARATRSGRRSASGRRWRPARSTWSTRCRCRRRPPGSRGDHRPVALLVFLAAATGTGIVATHLGLVAAHGASLGLGWRAVAAGTARLGGHGAAPRFDGPARLLALGLRHLDLGDTALFAAQLHVEQLLAH